MKRIVILFIFLHVFLANVNAQEKAANKIIDEINNVLDADKNATIKKFSLEAKNLVAFDKKGKKITASLNDIDSVTLNKNLVTLFCSQKKSCFFNNETKKYQASITCTHNTKALELSSKLQLLLKSFKNESTTQSQSTTYMDDFYADWFSESDEEPNNKRSINTAQINYSRSSKELAEINNYLKTFDGGYYGYMEIKEGYLINYFKGNNNHRKAKLTELIEAAVISVGKK